MENIQKYIKIYKNMEIRIYIFGYIKDIILYFDKVKENNYSV
jgi:hypothetical protein